MMRRLRHWRAIPVNLAFLDWHASKMGLIKSAFWDNDLKNVFSSLPWEFFNMSNDLSAAWRISAFFRLVSDTSADKSATSS
ncbi:hypothetical protein OGAPHI_000282 [Ogataea philodendri]|uniref:Uncharacterized protein n=1 Tax=Ogataea philodendri TaxID=1378263 RepID=A0A9P8PHY5_9ASCO|nr:uncharacterized protein OGAPHI_000282 [Ogataea philodendri]KAH3671579.1 hypothetical protein OGAPHI_000282 [Ogataea philodendri]